VAGGRVQLVTHIPEAMFGRVTMLQPTLANYSLKRARNPRVTYNRIIQMIPRILFRRGQMNTSDVVLSSRPHILCDVTSCRSHF